MQPHHFTAVPPVARATSALTTEPHPLLLPPDSSHGDMTTRAALPGLAELAGLLASCLLLRQRVAV